MKQSKMPLWKKSMLQHLNYDDIVRYLEEIYENGCEYGYEQFDREESAYYHEYKDHFDDLSAGAGMLMERLCEIKDEQCQFCKNKECKRCDDGWDDMTVALLGETHKVVGFDSVELDYYNLLSHQEEWAEEEAFKRIERLTKKELISRFRRVLITLLLFFDIKASHDCLTSIVEELDERAAVMKQGSGEPSPRAWVE